MFVYFALNSINLQPHGSSTPSWVWRQGVQVADGRESLAMLLLTTWSSRTWSSGCWTMILRAASSPTMPCSTASSRRLRMRGPIQVAACLQAPRWNSPSLQEPPPAPPLVQVSAMWNIWQTHFFTANTILSIVKINLQPCNMSFSTFKK